MQIVNLHYMLSKARTKA
jgi:N-acetyltransferase 10